MIDENLTLRARCIIKSGNSFLLIQQDVSNRERLIFVGGGIHSNESILQGVKREVKEEIGIDIPDHMELCLRAIREITIVGYYRCIEFFFFVDFGSDYNWDRLKINQYEKIKSVNLYTIDKLETLNPKPDFWKEIIVSNSVLFINKEFSLEEYANTFNDIPLCSEKSEMVYVMLKPDTIITKNQENVISDLIVAGGNLIFNKETKLNLDQMNTIYFDFSFESAREVVFDYLTKQTTGHLVFIGKPGLHQVFNRLKGKTGGKTGIRSKYVKNYTNLDTGMFQDWLLGNHPEQNKINLEMFCCNILHVAPTLLSSNDSIKSILLP